MINCDKCGNLKPRTIRLSGADLKVSRTDNDPEVVWARKRGHPVICDDCIVEVLGDRWTEYCNNRKGTEQWK